MKKISRSKDRGVLRGIDYDDPIIIYRGERVLSALRKLRGDEGNVTHSLAIDVFYSYYLPLPILEVEGNIPRSKTLHYQLIASMLTDPYVDQVKAHTIADSATSMVMAVSYLEKVLELLEQHGLKFDEESEGESQKGVGMSNRGESEGEEEYENQKKLVQEISREAMRRAAEEAETAKKIQRLAQGLSAGVGSSLMFEERVHEVLRLARNTDVRKILYLLSSLPKHSIKARRKVARHPRGELKGYEHGGDLERIVPSEIALPSEYFNIKFAENRLLLYEKVLPENWGPLYILLDKSGSMDGAKMLWAKAVALALYIKAVKEGRPFYMRFFDSVPYPLVKVSRRPRQHEALKLLEYIARIKGSGGTDISRAIMTACEDIYRGSVRNVSEIVLLTDGEDKISEPMVRRALMTSNAKLITVMIQGDNPDLRRLSSKYLIAVKLDKEEALNVVEL